MHVRAAGWRSQRTCAGFDYRGPALLNVPRCTAGLRAGLGGQEARSVVHVRRPQDRRYGRTCAHTDCHCGRRGPDPACIWDSGILGFWGSGILDPARA